MAGGRKPGSGAKKDGYVEQLTDFIKDSKNFINKCQKPDRKGKPC